MSPGLLMNACISSSPNTKIAIACPRAAVDAMRRGRSKLEISLDEAMRMIEAGAIQDGKTIMLLQYAQRIGLEASAERR